MHALCFKTLKKIKTSSNNLSIANHHLNQSFLNKQFSTTDSKSNLTTLQNLLFQTKEEKDLKYEDACYYFQKEFKKLQEDKIAKKQDYMSKDLSEHQQRECDILIERILKFNAFEARYFSYVFNDMLQNNSGASPYRPNVFDRRKPFEVDLSRPDDNPNHFNTQEILSPLVPFISSGFFSGGGGAAVAPVEKAEVSKAEEKKPKEEEKVVVKTFFI
jgi:hypothetical protein